MGWLDEIKKRASQFRQDVQNPHTGSWGGLPDFGFSEIIKPVHAAETQPQTQNLGQSIDPYAVNPYPNATYVGSLKGGTPQGGTPTPVPAGDVGQQTAESGLYSSLNSILDRLALMRDIAQRNIGTAGDVRNEIVGNIGTTYENLRTRAGQAKESALANLGQEDIGVQNLYGRAGGTARRAMESALTRNRMTARAMNRLNSSFYEDRQAEATEGGRRSVSDIGAEEAGKRAAIGTRTTEAKNWFENKVTDLGQEEAQLKSAAERDYQTQANAASDMERSYGIDSIGAAEQAQTEYQSRLDQITSYIQNKALRLAEIGATAGNTSGIIDAFKAITPELQGILGNTSALQAGQTLGSALQNQWSPLGGGAGDMAGFATMRENPEAEYYKKLRLLGIRI